MQTQALLITFWSQTTTFYLLLRKKNYLINYIAFFFTIYRLILPLKTGPGFIFLSDLCVSQKLHFNVN